MRILEVVHDTEIQYRALFSRDQRFLMKFQRRNIVDSDSSSELSEADDKIIDSFLKMKTIKETDGHPIKQRLIDMLQNFNDKELKSLERRLLTGVLVQK